MKTKEELNALKEEVETLNKKLSALTGEELKQVAGGIDYPAQVATGWYPSKPTSKEISSTLAGKPSCIELNEPN